MYISGLLAQRPFSTEETWFLQVTTKEKQEQGGEALLTRCLGLFISPSAHIISDTALQRPEHREESSPEPLKYSQLLISHSLEGRLAHG